MNLELLLKPDYLIDGRVALFPVRHHSPTAAFFVRQFIGEREPSSILIEGPSDYNKQISDLCLDHQLPLAIFSYARQKGKVRGFHYPFCEHSPEYVAVTAGIDAGASVEFIDLSLEQITGLELGIGDRGDIMADESASLSAILQRFEASDFNALWDKLVESDDKMDLERYLSTAHGLGLTIRQSLPDSRLNSARECFMAQRILEKLEKTNGLVLVVTGAFHSAGLFALLTGDRDALKPESTENSESVLGQSTKEMAIDRDPTAEQSAAISYGCTLTPFTDERLDSYRGYGAGLPTPGFYRQAYDDRQAGLLKDTHRTLLAKAIESLRAKKQVISTADTIVAEQMALGLANLRGHGVVFRQDLVDGIASSVVKDEFRFEDSHPLLEEIRAIFRGTSRGRLSASMPLPQLTRTILDLLAKHSLEVRPDARDVTVNLQSGVDLEKCHLLHRLQILGISGFSLIDFTGFAGNDQGEVIETWSIKETDQFHIDCVEAAAWGVTVEEALINKILERLNTGIASAETVANALMDTCLANLDHITEVLFERMEQTIFADSSFLSVASALSTLLGLLHYNRIFSTKPEQQLRKLLLSCFERALWLLEYQGIGATNEYIQGIGLILEVFQVLGPILQLDLPVLADSLVRAREQEGCSPVACGAICGALFKMQAGPEAQVGENLVRFSQCETVGDYMVGLLSIAGDIIHSDQSLLTDLDRVLRIFNDEEFLATAPPLRLAFSRYSPREKILLLRNLLQSYNPGATVVEPDLEFDVDKAAQVMALEAKSATIMRRFGLRHTNEP